jgi:hypothetical protein
MTNTPVRPDFAHVNDRLKDFQKATVAHAFHRLFEAEDSSHRFLVADEVGLGKTVVASGVIARMIERLWDTVGRIDIVYVCSNIDIARQNVNKLNVMGDVGMLKPTRLTMLPLELSGLNGKKVNFVSFTPTTSFDMNGGTGLARERALLYCMLKRAWNLGNYAAPINVMSVSASAERFRGEVERINNGVEYPLGIDAELLRDFERALEEDTRVAARENRLSLRQRFEAQCAVFSRSNRQPDRDETRARNALIGELRHLLANTCIKALQPDLVILDEFQRFKDMLDGENDASELAKELFNYSDESSAVRVLLLSATPYKMYTMRDEAGDEDHYSDFVSTLKFLFNNESDAAAIANQLTALRKAIYKGDEGRETLQSIRTGIEQSLRRVMSRTERLAASSDRSGMLRDVPAVGVTLTADDASTYCALQQVGRELEQPDVIEFWKSAPFLLNFMEAYKLKSDFTKAIGTPSENGAAAAFRRAVSAGVPIALPTELVEAQGELIHPHPRMRWLLGDVVKRGSWRLLWLAPSLPYYQLGGVFADPLLKDFTKRLVFSAWKVAPKAIATLVSYEAERRMLETTRRPAESRTAQLERAAPLLNFAQSAGRLTGMPVLGLLYPSITLARLGDPLSVQLRRAGPRQSVDTMLTQIEARIAEPLKMLLAEAKQTPAVDEAWYWAAPILLDLRKHRNVAQRWLQRPDIATRWSGAKPGTDDETVGWNAHVERVLNLLKMGAFHDLGTPPADLSRVLAEMALAGPAVCALRALSRSRDADTCLENDAVRDAAAAVAHGFRGLFNLPEVISLLRGMNNEEPYWRRTLEYSVNGCLQAVLDEYAHVLQSYEGVTERVVEQAANDIAARMRQALGLRTSRLGVDSLTVAANGRVMRDARTMRARFAMRFGDEASDDEKDANRKEAVRAAFNSPFWPFVLASTSVGQEGLDFHLYCHAVVHWNIPPNPVDMEQREGRVHRFKGHAVRKNVAAKHGADIESDAAEDPWTALFELAIAWRDEGASDLVPYWLYPLTGGAAIERHVPNLPLSRDAARYTALKRSLAVYRMVFGQPRQEDLMEYLLAHPNSSISPTDLQIDLSPAR